MFGVLKLNSQLETFFAYFYVFSFTALMAFILREILGKNWKARNVWLTVILIVVVFYACDQLFIDQSFHFPPPTNSSCAPHQVQVMGYCD
jgi:hypothetical protein